MKFTGNDSEFNLNKHTPEFDEWMWRDLSTMPNLVVDFKKKLYDCRTSKTNSNRHH